MDIDRFFVFCLIKRHLSKSSIRATRSRYNVLLHWLQNRPLTADTVEEFILYLREKGLENTTINSYLRVIGLINTFERDNGNDLNLMKRVSYFRKVVKVPTILSIEEIESILAVKRTYACRNGWKGVDPDVMNEHINKKYYLMILFLASSGCRISEMTHLTVSHLHLGIDDGYAELVDTKTKLDRNVPLPSILVVQLKDWIIGKKPSEYVFCDSSKKEVSQTNVFDEIIERARLAGINKRVHPHAFRHSYIMQHLRCGTDIATIARLVGHTDLTSTANYMKFNMDDLVRGAENHPLFAHHTKPQRILEKLKEQINKWSVMSDCRFEKRIETRNNSLLFEVYVK